MPSSSLGPASCTNNDPTKILIKYSGAAPGEMRKCRHCSQFITDLYYLDIASKFQWHSTCLKCCVCECVLDTSCLIKNGMFYCKNDYERMYWDDDASRSTGEATCRTCYKTIESSDYVIRINADFIYHSHCFFCYLCSKRIDPGEKYGILNNIVLCDLHFNLSQRSFCVPSQYDSSQAIAHSNSSSYASSFTDEPCADQIGSNSSTVDSRLINDDNSSEDACAGNPFLIEWENVDKRVGQSDDSKYADEFFPTPVALQGTTTFSVTVL